MRFNIDGFWPALYFIERHRRDYIEDQKQTQAVLRESEERLMLVEATNLGIWDWNLITGVIHLSNRFKTISGLPPEAADYKERTNF